MNCPCIALGKYFLNSYEEEYMSLLIYVDKIQERHLPLKKSASLMIDDGAIDDGEEFVRSFTGRYFCLS